MYSPIPYEAEYDRLAYVDTTGLVPDTQITYEILGENPPSLFKQILAVSDGGQYDYYHVRIVERPDYGSMLPIPPKEVVNLTGSSLGPAPLRHVLNPCTTTRLIITTEITYFIKDFPQTVVCG